MPTITQIMKHETSSHAATHLRFRRLTPSSMARRPRVTSDNYSLLAQSKWALFEKSAAKLLLCWVMGVVGDTAHVPA
jgi:hypothetical protein